MSEILAFSQEEREDLKALCRKLRGEAQEKITLSDYRFLKKHIDMAIADGKICRERFGLNPVILDLKTAHLVTGEIGHKREIIISILLHAGGNYIHAGDCHQIW